MLFTNIKRVHECSLIFTQMLALACFEISIEAFGFYTCSNFDIDSILSVPWWECSYWFVCVCAKPCVISASKFSIQNTHLHEFHMREFLRVPQAHGSFLLFPPHKLTFSRSNVIPIKKCFSAVDASRCNWIESSGRMGGNSLMMTYSHCTQHIKKMTLAFGNSISN